MHNGPFPAEADIYRFRKQKGVNLGSWFVLERWIANSPFRFAISPGQSDLDVARGSNAKTVLEEHWDNWITEQDWAWIADQGINTVRIPIGYYHICGADPSVLQGTDFADLGDVFAGAWSRITKALATAHRYRIGVLFDLHAAPGKQNRDSHSGTSASNPAFFSERRNMPHTIHVLTALLSNLGAFSRAQTPPLPNLVGIELLNEPAPGGHNHALEKWYRETFRALRAVDADIPLYIGDAWMTDQYAGFLADSKVPFAVLDHHLYRCFTKEDISTSAAQHARVLTEGGAQTPQMFGRVSRKLESAGGALVVGEWSGALNPGSLQGSGNQLKDQKAFVEAQLSLYERWCSGWFFWTYKKEQAGDKGWSFRDAVNAGVIPPGWDWWQRSRWKTALTEFAGGIKHETKPSANIHHIGHVSSTPPSSPVPELGFIGPWVKRRSQVYVTAKGDTNRWEYEHGLPQGIAAARKDFANMYC
ncbi:Glucan 1,3-beta-glucosidase 3 [Grifola frondosa]|uniref:Glucan 1,3-beta-glucosidase 3 n=1 Tax=Grifola frondosa TaxID=5627 RepID=A0A1C7LLA8_GRIFR|nr:Glucan 1,3-beta-glucosidase 3 [Grifola frondosa]